MPQDDLKPNDNFSATGATTEEDQKAADPV
jgi:hypothetical protein